MLPRFSLYGDPSVWNGNVQEDVEGRWLRWKDAESYVLYALAHGYVPPTVDEPTPQPALAMIDVVENQLEMFDPTPTEDDGDVYDLVMGQAKERFDGEEV